MIVDPEELEVIEVLQDSPRFLVQKVKLNGKLAVLKKAKTKKMVTHLQNELVSYSIYQELLAKYPNCPFKTAHMLASGDGWIILSFLEGKSGEELVKEIIEDVDSKPERLDTFVAQNCEGKFSRSSVSKLIVQGRVKLNGQVASSKALKAVGGDEVEVDYEDPVASEDLKVIFEDDDQIVISKPAGMLSHAKGPISGEVSVADWLQPKTTDLDAQRSGIVHRLDRATSGVMILAKNPKSKSWLMKQFSDRNVHKKYLAVIEGSPESTKFKIDMPIGRNPKKLTTFYVTDSGREAQTEVEVLSTNGKESLVLLSPKTGRTHQLRVHMWANGWPILGDPFYNDSFKDGQELMLHASSLEIQLSGDEWKRFDVQPPAYFLDKLAELKLDLPDM